MASAAGANCPAFSRVFSTSRTRARCWPCANSTRSRAKRVLDLCAAPGGKLTYIAQLMRNQGRARCARYRPRPPEARPGELRPPRRDLCRGGVGLPPSALHPPVLFDRILLDAPCSNTGVMRRRVDLRWRIRPEEIERLRAGQMELLARRAAAQAGRDAGL